MKSTCGRHTNDGLHCRYRAFTLIELLVVIAIISIVAAILFPVFAKAKDGAKKATCISNVKQLSLASLMYSADADDLVIPYVIILDDEGFLAQGWSALLDLNLNNVDFSQGLITPYVHTKNLFICPSSSPNLKNQVGIDDFNRYGLNTYLDVNYGINDFRPFSHSSVELPTETLLLADAAVYLSSSSEIMASDLINAQCAGRARAHGRHFGKANVGWFDGHASANTVDVPTRDDSTDQVAGTMSADFMKKHNLGDILKFPRTYKNGPPDARVSGQTMYYYALQKPAL